MTMTATAVTAAPVTETPVTETPVPETAAKTRPRPSVQELVTKFVRQGLDRPLSEDDPDIYYPDSDGNPMAETDAQFYPLTETVLALRQRYVDQDDVYVSGDLLVYYRMNDNTVRLAPDVFVVFGIDDHLRSSYIIWREQGKTPDFVLEIASPGTYVRDMTEKPALYAALYVTEYWQFDPTGKLLPVALIGGRLTENGEYEPIPVVTGEDGILRGHSEVLQLDLCVRFDPELQLPELRLYDPEQQTWLSYLADEIAARQAAEAARDSAEAAQADAEAARDDAEAARDSAEAARDDAETARDSAEARARALEEQLRRHGLLPEAD